jgi:hypothetical protein
VRVAGGVDEDQRLEIIDDRLHGQSSPVDVGGDRAPERESVGAGLLLRHRPARRCQMLKERGPLDPRLDLDYAALVIQGENAVERARVEQ